MVKIIKAKLNKTSQREIANFKDVKSAERFLNAYFKVLHKKDADWNTAGDKLVNKNTNQIIFAKN